MTNHPDSTETGEAPQTAQEAPAASRSSTLPHPGPEAAVGPVADAHEASEAHANPTPRPRTPDRRDGNTTTMKVKRACNGCGQLLGDVTDIEVDRAIAGLPPIDVRAECGHCHPLVELEAQGCRTWELTRRSFHQVAHEIDQLKPWVFTKGYWQEVDGKLQVVGLRVGQYPDHVVAYFGDWLIRHPNGTFTVHKAPEAVTG